MAEREPLQSPMVLAFIVNDAIWQDANTGKKTIIGTFSVIFADTYPLTYPHIALYVALTDGRDDTPITIQIVGGEDEDEVLLDIRTQVVFDDPLAVGEVIINAGEVTFPGPGDYWVQLRAYNELLLERKIEVRRSN